MSTSEDLKKELELIKKKGFDVTFSLTVGYGKPTMTFKKTLLLETYIMFCS